MPSFKDEQVHYAKAQLEKGNVAEAALVMRYVAEVHGYLVQTQIELLWSSYKHFIQAKRKALRGLIAQMGGKAALRHEDMETLTSNTELWNVFNRFLGELCYLCQDLLRRICSRYITRAQDMAAKIYIFHIRADCFRYMAEYGYGWRRAQDAENALSNYTAGANLALMHFEPSNPLLLNIYVNRTIALHVLMGQTRQAACMAKGAVERAEMYLAERNMWADNNTSAAICLLCHNAKHVFAPAVKRELAQRRQQEMQRWSEKLQNRATDMDSNHQYIAEQPSHVDQAAISNRDISATEGERYPRVPVIEGANGITYLDPKADGILGIYLEGNGSMYDEVPTEMEFTVSKAVPSNQHLYALDYAPNHAQEQYVPALYGPEHVGNNDTGFFNDYAFDCQQNCLQDSPAAAYIPDLSNFIANPPRDIEEIEAAREQNEAMQQREA